MADRKLDLWVGFSKSANRFFGFYFFGSPAPGH